MQPKISSLRGFTLVEVAMVILILTVLLAGVAKSISSSTESRRIDQTKTKLLAIEAALTQFVMQNQRLPCPANATANTGLEGARTNPAVGCDTQVNGVLPWVALGLSRDEVTDEWSLLYTYRVSIPLTANGGMDMHRCNPAKVPTMTGAKWEAIATCSTLCNSVGDLTTANCTAPNNFLAGKGLNVRDVGGTVLAERDPDAAAGSPTGAAYIVLSHGPTKGGGFTNAGVASPASPDDGLREAFNYANLELRNAATDFYTDDSLRMAAGMTHFDDFVLRPSILNVATKAGLQPRASP